VFYDSIAGLKQFRGGQALQIGLRNPPPVAELAGAAADAEVDAINANLFRVRPRGGIDPTDTLVRAAVERNWGLYLLQPALASLEEVFAHLTQREDDQNERASA